MNHPDIAIVNFSSIPDRQVLHAIRSVNRQVMDDFLPIWGSAYVCQLHNTPFGLSSEEDMADEPVKAAGVIYLVDEAHLTGALGYHASNASEVPYGFVFTDLGDWTITLSHEVLELIIDPTVNIFVPGPDPRFPGEPDRWLFHTYEVCDAVERTSYSIDGVEVSNFVTPQYFHDGDAAGTRNDFLGVGVASFGVTPGSHLGVIDPNTWEWDVIYGRENVPSPRNMARCHEFTSKIPRARLDEEGIKSSHLNETFERFVGSSKLPAIKRMQGMSRGQRYAEASKRLRYGRSPVPGANSTPR